MGRVEERKAGGCRGRLGKFVLCHRSTVILGCRLDGVCSFYSPDSPDTATALGRCEVKWLGWFFCVILTTVERNTCRNFPDFS